jgi:hypothetical protein
MVGAGYAWIVANLLPFLGWLPVVHRRFLKGLHLAWLTTDIGRVLLLPTIAAALVLHFVDWPSGRWWTALLLLAIYAGLFLLAAGSASAVTTRLSSLAVARIA